MFILNSKAYNIMLKITDGLTGGIYWLLQKKF